MCKFSVLISAGVATHKARHISLIKVQGERSGYDIFSEPLIGHD